MKSWDYYGHYSKGFISDYFGHIGIPRKISVGRYYALKAAGYRVTKVPSGSDLKSVATKALIDDGTNLNSFSAEKYFKEIVLYEAGEYKERVKK